MSVTAIVTGGSRREINVMCPSCNHGSQIPPAAVIRNNFFCARCGSNLDLSQVFKQLAGGTSAAPTGARPEKRDSRYKSARKGRR